MCVHVWVCACVSLTSDCSETIDAIIINIGKGIQIKDQEFLLSQFADDTTVCLDGSEESLRECIKTLKAFSLIIIRSKNE